MSDDSANTFILSQYAFKNQNITTSNTRGGASVSEGISVDRKYELSAFNTPATLKGTAFVELISALRVNGSYSSGSVNSYAIIKIIKWDGDSETILGTNKTETKTFSVPSGSGETFLTNFTTDITIPRTLFKKGDILRVNIIIYEWHSINSASGVTTHLYQEPVDREHTFIPSSEKRPMKINIPFFLIDL